MAYEWGRLMWWSGQNAAALQALTAIVVMFLTFVLIGITSYYAYLTRRMALTMERQIASSFQPNVALAFASRSHGQSSSDGIPGNDSVFAYVVVTNKAEAFLKLSMLSMRVVFEDGTYQNKAVNQTVDGVVLPPTASKEFWFDVEVQTKCFKDETQKRTYAPLL